MYMQLKTSHGKKSIRLYEKEAHRPRNCRELSDWFFANPPWKVYDTNSTDVSYLDDTRSMDMLESIEDFQISRKSIKAIDKF